MKVSSKLFTLFFLFQVSFSYSQVDSIKTNTNDFYFLENGFDINWKPKSSKLSVNSLLASNSINATMFSDFILRTSFTPKAKEDFFKTSVTRTNLAANLNADVEIKISKKGGVYAKSTNVLYYSSNSDFAKLALFGNKRYAGEEVKSGKLQFISASTLSIGFSHSLIRNDKIKLKTRLGFNLVENYNNIYADEISLFTQQDGEYIDASANSLSYLKSTDKLAGVGLDFDFNLSVKRNEKSTWTIDLENLQPTHLLNRTEIQIDTSFTYEGLDFNPFTQDSLSSFNSQLDSTIETFTKNENQKKFVLLPSNIRLVYRRELNDKNTLVASISTIDLTKLGTYARVSHLYNYGPNLLIRSTIGYGNYTSLQWNEAIEFHAGKRINIFLEARGINAMFMPSKSTSYGASFGISNRF